MSKHFQYFFLSLLIIGIILPGCGSRNISDSDSDSDEKYIIIEDEEQEDSFTNDILKNFVKKTPKPSIIVRSSSSTGSISSSASSSSTTDKMCSLLERALAKNEYDVRDRSLFESAVLSFQNSIQNSSISNTADSVYMKLYDATHVDLLMEISNYSLSDYYYINGYYDRNRRFKKFEEINEGTEDKPRWVQPQYIFRGMSISIKVILLKDNLLGGSYSYSYIPCSKKSGGAVITQMYPLRYQVPNDARDLEAVMDDDRGYRIMETRGQRLDRHMEKFLTDVVVPGILKDITKSKNEFLESQEDALDNEYNPSYATNISDIRSNQKNNSGDNMKTPLKKDIASYDPNKQYTFASLLEVFDIHTILNNYQSAVVISDQKIKQDIEYEIWDIISKVNKNTLLPNSIRVSFVEYVEMAEKEIKQNYNDRKSTSPKHNDNYSLAYLLESFDVQEKLDGFSGALYARDKKRAKSIVNELENIVSRVNDNKGIPKSIRETFENYIELAAEEIEQDYKNNRRKEKKSN